MENDDIFRRKIMQKHVLKFILLETMHRDLYQKDIEEEFQIRETYSDRDPEADGEERLHLQRECETGCTPETDHSHREKAEKIRPAILKSIEEGEAKMLRGIPIQ